MADPTATSPTALRRVQLGQETTPGTAVPATIKWPGTCTMKETLILSRPKDETGTMADARRTSVVGEEVDISLEGNLTYESILYLLNLCMKEVATGAGIGDDKTWTFSPALTGINTPNFMTIEYGDGNEEHEAYFCMGKSLELNFAVNEPLKGKAVIVGQNLTVASFTAALPLPTDLEEILGSKMMLYIDALGGTIGTTLEAATLIDGSFKLSGFEPSRHGAATIYYDTWSQPPIHIECDLTLEFNAGAKAQRAIYQAGTQQLFRLKATGTLITGAIYKTLTIDFCGVYTDFSTLEERDGADVVSVKIEGELNSSTWAKLVEIVVVNKTATLT